MDEERVDQADVKQETEIHEKIKQKDKETPTNEETLTIMQQGEPSDTVKIKSEPENKKASSEKEDDLVNKFKNIRKSDNLENEEDSASMIQKLMQTEKNMGMKFSESKIENATFIINNHMPSDGSPQAKEHRNLLCDTNRIEFLEWCSSHYQDLHFSMMLAVCILDRHPYQEIDKMARELHYVFKKQTEEDDTQKVGWNFKSQIAEVLGVVEYTDFTSVREVQVEADFWRLPIHKLSEECIQRLVKEFPELKHALTRYLIKKIMEVFGSGHNYMIVSSCLEALAFIGSADLLFFNENVLKILLHQNSVGMDYCLSVLLVKLYAKSKCRKFVITCVEQWAKVKNQPHCSLVVLYVCSCIGGQEMLVRDIWMNILDKQVEEILDGCGNEKQGMSYFDMMRELFESGNRNFSYHKGVIHAFYLKGKKAEMERDWEKVKCLNLLFLLCLMDDYACCHVSGNQACHRSMVWLSILRKLDEKTGKELIHLWCSALNNRIYPKEGWDILERYLAEYENYDLNDVEGLAFFFYHMNQQMGKDRGLYFLKRCAERKRNPIILAGQIYKRIKE